MNREDWKNRKGICSTKTSHPFPELDLLSAILNNFNDLFGNIEWSDADNVRRQIAEILSMVATALRYR